MLAQITSLTRNGLKDWLVQRVSAIILACYFLLILGYVVGHHPLQYQDWYALFNHTFMRAFTVLALISLIAHSWVGMWTVFTDYLSCTLVRGTVIVLMVLTLVVYFVWAISILWG